MDVEVRSDNVKVSDEAIEKYYVKVMGTPEPKTVYENQSKRDRRLSIGKEERENSNWAQRTLADKSYSTITGTNCCNYK